MLNADSPEFPAFAASAYLYGQTVFSVGEAGHGLHLADRRPEPYGQELILRFRGRGYSVRLPLAARSHDFDLASVPVRGADGQIVSLEQIARIAPHCVRITMSSPTVFEDVSSGPTTWLRFWFPDPDGSDTEFQRAYTISEADVPAGCFAVDAVLHEPAGPDLLVEQPRIDERDAVAAHRVLRRQLLGVEHEATVDREVARLKLAALGARVDDMTDDQREYRAPYFKVQTALLGIVLQRAYASL